ncbi:MAG: DUF2075 domain-containing protein [Candidatus Aenigmarchaeota archaeon]|nr:DUF2075 domain-containing protein [Candidatus Aenigmarchaeota archaeon]
MQLYAGTSAEFIEDTVQNKVADKILEEFEKYYGRRPSPSEITSWRNSLQYMKNVIEYNSLFDNMIILEHELPYSTERIDFILFGRDGEGKEMIVVLELKQWEKVKDCDIDGNVITFLGGSERMQAHPSFQVRGYAFYLKDFVEVLHDDSITLDACVYCHNYPRKESSVLFYPKFKEIEKQFPVFSKEDFKDLGKYLKARLSGGKGLEVFNRFSMSRIRPSKKLVDVAKKMIEGQNVFNLIDEQLAANNTIIDRAKKCSKIKKKSVIIVRGGPGTGKSVIALNALAELLSKKLVVYHATGSAAFTQTLRKIVGPRAANLFKYFNSFMRHKSNEIDILICDEAHRIRKTSNSRFTKMSFRSDTPQIEELVNAAKVSIFFIDDDQVVRPDEIGSTQLIKLTAQKFDAEIYDFELKTQFRCSGSDGYLNWIDNIFEIRETANRILTKNEKMEFKIFDTPQALYDEIKKKNSEKPNSARLVAGFCCPWSDANSDGTLKEDVVIGDFKITWEAKNDATKIAPGIPKAALWAYDPNGINQAGSIYTIQGFEFDYVGVIFAKDLVWDPIKKQWIGIPENSADAMVKRDKTNFTSFAKNVYRVLMTRGMKGCYVYFMDESTRKYFEEHIEKRS